MQDREGETPTYGNTGSTNTKEERLTEFSFEIIQFFARPLERQVGEAVRIVRTGASQILNSKTM